MDDTNLADEEYVWKAVETMEGPRTPKEIAEMVGINAEFVEIMVKEMVELGLLSPSGDDAYEVNENWFLADRIREVGEEVEEGVLIRSEVLQELRSRKYK